MSSTSCPRSFSAVVFACTMLLAGAGALATPLPPEFGGGFVPPSEGVERRERSALLLTEQLLANPENSLVYCGWRGVERLRGDKPAEFSECFDRWEAIYALKAGRLDVPACFDPELARQAVEVAALTWNNLFWCDPTSGTPLPPEFGGGFLPADRPTFLGEKAAAQAFARLSRRTVRCYRLAVADIVDGDPTDIPGCLADALDDYTKRLARIVPPRRILPACTVPPMVAGAFADFAAQALNPIVYCAE